MSYLNDGTTRSFRTGYLDRGLYHLPEVLDQAEHDLRGVNFDTFVGTGFSGAIVIPSLALRMSKHFVLIRKETDDSHHGSGLPVGTIGKRWIFVDDFVSSGETKRRVMRKIEAAATLWGDDHTVTYVGDFLYVQGGGNSSGFVPAVDQFI